MAMEWVAEEVQIKVMRPPHTENHTVVTDLTDRNGWVMGWGSTAEEEREKGVGVESYPVDNSEEGAESAVVLQVVRYDLWQERSWIDGRTRGMGGWARHLG